MIQAIINHLGQDLTALPKEASHGLAQIIEGVPSVYTGDGNYRPVTDDAAGGFSYWRLSGTVTSSPYSDIGCTNAQRVSVPLMFVAFIPRELCTDPDSEAWRLQSVITARVAKLGKRIRGVFRSAVTSTESGADMIRTSEIRRYVVPAHLAVLHVKLTVVLHGDNSCVDLCGPVEVPCTPTDCPDACDVIQALQWTEVEGCLTDEQKEGAIESLCGPCPPCDDGVVKLNGAKVGDVPSGGEVDVPVTRQGTNTPVGSWNSGAGRYEIAPATWTLKNTADVELDSGSIPSSGSAEIVAPDGIVKLNGVTVAPAWNVPSNGEKNIRVVNTIGDEVGGDDANEWWIADSTIQLKNSEGTNLGSPITVPAEQYVEYTVADVVVEINDVQVITVPAGAWMLLYVLNTENEEIGSKDGGIWRIADSTISVNGTQETALPAEQPLNIVLLDENADPVTPNSITPGTGTLTIEVPASAPSANTLLFDFPAHADESMVFTVPAALAGTYLTMTDDGNSGTITISVNGGAFVSVPASQVLTNGDTIQVKRTNTGAGGWAQYTTA